MVYELVAVWNGERERRGEAPSLTTYAGRSSLHHSPPWSDLDEQPAKPRAVPRAHDDAVVELLRKSVSYGAIARQLGVASHTVRSIARRYRLERASRLSWL